MKMDSLILLLTTIASGFTIFFFVKRNQEDKKELMEKLMEKDEISILDEKDCDCYRGDLNN
jgi:hypothetical protein